MSNSFNRRNFLQASALAGAATLFSPSLQAKNLDMIMTSDIGKSKWDLDTPTLCVDLDKMEQNLKTVHTRLKGTGVGTRPHVKTHKSPAIAKMQIAAGALGVCAAKLGEAEVMLNNGIKSVTLTTANVSVPKIVRAMALRKKYKGLIQATDNPQNVQDLQDAAKAAGIVAEVVVDIDVIKRTGVAPMGPALALAQMIDKMPNLKFCGILAYDGAVQHVVGYEARRAQALKTFEPVVKTFEMMKAAGLNTEIFSGGGTGTYDIMTEVPGLTDVQVGSYLFMDNQYIEIGGAKNATVFDDFVPSLTVLATILNNYHQGRITTDGGAKAFTLNKPTPYVIGEPGFSYNAGSDEFGAITYEKISKTYKVGDKLEMIVPHCDPIVNLYDVIHGIRNGKVESIIPVLARGKSQ
jgi:D-serine deaminase-like pyridoxal phosphate-dependent protein